MSEGLHLGEAWITSDERHEGANEAGKSLAGISPDTEAPRNPPSRRGFQGDHYANLEVHIGTVLINDGYRILWGNDVVLSILGCRLDDIIGERCYVALFSYDEPCPSCPARTVLKTSGSAICRAGEGSDGLEYLSACPLGRRDDGSIDAILVNHHILSDRTDRRPPSRDRRDLRSLVRSTPEIVGAIDESGKLLFAQGMPESLVGANIVDVLGPQDPSLFEDAIRMAFAGGEQRTFDVKIEDDPDEPVIYNITLWPMANGNGTELTYMVARNSSWESDAISALTETEERFRAIFNEAGVGMVQVARDGRIMDVNQTFSHVVGLPLDELEAMGITDVMHPDDADRVEEMFQVLYEGGTDSTDFEARLVDQGGSTAWVHATSILPKDHEGVFDYVIMMVEDITQRKEMEETLRHRTEFDRMLSEVSSHLNDCPSLAIDRAIEHALERLTAFMDVHASFIFQNIDGKREVHLRSLKTSGEVPEGMYDDEDALTDPGARLVDALTERMGPGGPGQDPVSTPSGRAVIIREEGVGSFLVVHILSWGITSAYIGLWSTDHSEAWSEERAEGLFSFGRLLAFALHRQNLMEESISLFEQSSDFLVIIDRDNREILKTNPAFKRLLDDQRIDDQRPDMLDLVHPPDRMRLEHHLEKMGRSGSESEEIHLRLINRSKSLRWVEMRCHPSPEGSLVYCVGLDVTDKKRAQMRDRRRKMKFRLEEGNIYLDTQQESPVAKEVVGDLVDVGYQAYVFSRDPEPDISSEDVGNPEFFWLAESEDRRSMAPTLEAIRDACVELPRGSVVLIDRLDYLIFKQGFESTLAFVHYLSEIAYLNEYIVIISLDASTIKSNHLRMMEKECNELRPVHTRLLSNELMEPLRIASMRDLSNMHTTYDVFTKELRISRPTARKRVGTLVYMGYLREGQKGKRKTFSVTDKGRNLLSP